MTKREQQRLFHQENTLINLGFTMAEAEQLRRISMTLHRWHEHECNGAIQRDEETGKCYWYNADTGRKLFFVADRETGALNRLKAIMGQRNGRPAIVDGQINAKPTGDVQFYIQGDPRGAALYIIRPGDVPEGKEVGAYYSRGVVVY